MIATSPLVIDACVLLNLHASGRIKDVLLSSGRRCVASRYATSESLWYRDGDKRIDADFEPLVAEGILEVRDLASSGEFALFVALAADLGDGEAATGAIAASLSATAATDDKKALRIFRDWDPPITTIGTVGLLKDWESTCAVPREKMTEVLRSIRLRASYRPSPGSPEAEWWLERDGSAES